MKRFNVKHLEKLVLFTASISAAMLLMTTLAFGQERENQTVKGTIKVERGADLKALAKITPEQAKAAALARVSGATAEEEAELENEGGYLVYEVELNKDGDEIEVLVDAGDGSILEVEGLEDEGLEDEGTDVGEEEAEEAEFENEEGQDEEQAAEMEEAEASEQAELPEAVEAAFEQAYPNAEIVGTEVEEKDGERFYEIESRDGEQQRDLLYRPDGTLYETEEAIAPDVLPEAVRTVAEAQGEITEAERVTRGDEVQYEIHVRQDEQTHELLLDAEGHEVETSGQNGNR